MIERANEQADFLAMLEQVRTELRKVRAEGLLAGLLAKHAVAILIRRSNEPDREFGQLKAATYTMVKDMNIDDTYGEAEEEIRLQALAMHEKIFDELTFRG